MAYDIELDEFQSNIISLIIELESKGYQIRHLLTDEILKAVDARKYVKMTLAEKLKLEDELTHLLGRALRREEEKLFDLLGDPPSYSNVPIEFWKNGGKELEKVLAPFVADVFRRQSYTMLEGLPIGVDWTLVNQRAIDYAATYSSEWIGKLIETQQNTVRDSISAFFENGLTRGELEDLLKEGAFGDMSASRIAVTEVTRASAGSVVALQEELAKQGVSMNMVWHTNNDELVCDYCGPINGHVQGDGWDEPPPAHVNCRCDVGLEIPG